MLEALRVRPGLLKIGPEAGMSLHCTHRPPCSGCPRLGAGDIGERARRALQELSNRNELGALQVVFGESSRFRLRARLAVRGRASSPKIGIFEPGTHRVVDIPNCLVHHPLVNDVARAAKRALVRTRTPPYSDEAHRGLLRYLQVVVERRSETVQVVVVTNSEEPGPAEPFCAELADRIGDKLHSLHWNGNTDRTNTILGAKNWKRISGSEAVEETIGGARVFYPPGAFGQSNLGLADALVGRVHARVPAEARVFELYAGVGPIGLGLVRRSAKVAFNEQSPDSLAGLELGIGALPPELGEKTEILAGPAGAMSDAIRNADIVIADPPRKGLDPAVREAVASSPPSRFFYVSCGLPSFLSDIEWLCRTGALRVTELVAFDLFPHTEHVEVLAQLEPVRSATPTSRRAWIEMSH